MDPLPPDKTTSNATLVAECDAAIEHARRHVANLEALRARLVAPPVEYVDQDSREILARYGLNKRTFLEKANAGLIKTHKVKRKHRTTTPELDRWYATCAHAPRPAPESVVDDVGAAIDLAAERVARRAASRAAK